MTSTTDRAAAGTTSTTTSHDRRRRARALLAGGLVLGVGAAVTLAAWNDSEFATGTFTAGTYNLQGSTNGTDFTDHATAATAAPIAFTAPFDNLSPDDVVYAPFWLRLAPGTTEGADLTLTGLDSTDSGGATNSAALAWAVYELPAADATCGAAAVAGLTPLASAATLADLASPTSGTVALAAGTPATDAGATELLCFQVTAGADLAQGGITTATWQFTAVTD